MTNDRPPSGGRLLLVAVLAAAAGAGAVLLINRDDDNDAPVVPPAVLTPEEPTREQRWREVEDALCAGYNALRDAGATRTEAARDVPFEWRSAVQVRC